MISAERKRVAPDGEWLRVSGTRIVTDSGTPVLLRGVGVGGWLNMENFITGYPGTESQQRAALRAAMGDVAYRAFFRRFTDCFFAAGDAEYLASLGVNCVRLPVNYRMLDREEEPAFVLDDDGLAVLDAAAAACAEHGIYLILDLHALPGGQNGDWHSDNATHRASLWDHRMFQDRAVALWEALAAHFAGNPWVAGYNPVNEPVDPGGEVLTAFYARVAEAIRAADPGHILFLDGNRYGTDFSSFGELAERLDNVVWAVHDYALPGIAAGSSYPGLTRGEWFDREAVEQTFLRRTEFMRSTGTPVWVGEFGPIYTGSPDTDEMRYALLRDQLDIYAAHGAGWSLWTYKDLGLQGLVTVPPASAYVRRIGAVLEKKKRLGVDSWGGDDASIRQVLSPLEDLVAAEFADVNPYPWGQRQLIARLVRHILLAELMVPEFGRCFAGVDAAEAEVLASSFAFAACDRNERLAGLVRAYASGD